MIIQAEYLWIDGGQPTRELRSKTRVVCVPEGSPVHLRSFPPWNFDGSSTYQADGSDSDLILEPVTFVRDALRGGNNYLVLCEVFNGDGTDRRRRGGGVRGHWDDAYPVRHSRDAA